jgi:N-acetylglucosaminyldiphosphoundecaprenol N-acetyl-beta-D-mannosaminyltransferase
LDAGHHRRWATGDGVVCQRVWRQSGAIRPRPARGVSQRGFGVLRWAGRGYRIFLLGTEQVIVERAAERLRVRFPGLEVAAHHGFFDLDGAENAAVLERIAAFAPHVVLVGMGMPRQERWIARNAPALEANVTMSVGALFDYLAERVARGPRWLTDNGFEWVCRLWYEPRRLWRRYLLGNPRFLWLIARQRLRRLGV